MRDGPVGKGTGRSAYVPTHMQGVIANRAASALSPVPSSTHQEMEYLIECLKERSFSHIRSPPCSRWGLDCPVWPEGAAFRHRQSDVGFAFKRRLNASMAFMPIVRPMILSARTSPSMTMDMSMLARMYSDTVMPSFLAHFSINAFSSSLTHHRSFHRASVYVIMHYSR
jgi:hypothetical protein